MSEYVPIGHLVVTRNEEFRATEITLRRGQRTRHHRRDIQVEL